MIDFQSGIFRNSIKPAMRTMVSALALSAGMLGVSSPAMSAVAQGAAQCNASQAATAANTCISNVKYHEASGLTDTVINALLAENNWRLATEAEVRAAWAELDLHQSSFGKINGDQYMSVLQYKDGLLEPGVHVRDSGVAMVSTGFYYVDYAQTNVVVATATITTVQNPDPAPASVPQPAATQNTGCADGLPAVEKNGQLVCQTPIQLSSSPSGPTYVEAGGPIPQDYFVNLATERCADPGNLMLDGWNEPERGVLESAKAKFVRDSSWLATGASADSLPSRLRSDPQLRWKFAPFLLEAAWEALLAENKTPAQAAFKARFDTWSGCDKNLTARRNLARWAEYTGTQTSADQGGGVGVYWVDMNPQYQPATLSTLSDTGPGLNGFDVTNNGNPLYLGSKGQQGIASLVKPFMVRVTPDFPDPEGLVYIDEDFTEMLEQVGVKQPGDTDSELWALLGMEMTALVVAEDRAWEVYEEAAGAVNSVLGLLQLDFFLPTSDSNIAVAQLALVKITEQIVKKLVSKTAGNAIGPITSGLSFAATILEAKLSDVVGAQQYEASLRRDASNTDPVAINPARLKPTPYNSYSYTQASSDDPAVERAAIFALLMKMVIAEPADRNALTMKVPILPCPIGTKKAGETCTADVRFHDLEGLSLQEAKQYAETLHWVLATPEIIESAWRNKAIHQYSFGMMSDGRFAVPVQRDFSNFKTGANIGAVGGNQGFFYLPDFVHGSQYSMSGTVVQNAEDMTAFLPVSGQFNADRSSAWKLVSTGAHLRLEWVNNPDQFAYYENGTLKIGPLAADNRAGHWQFHRLGQNFYRIESVAAPEHYIQVNDGALTVGYIEPNSKASIWHLPGVELALR